MSDQFERSPAPANGRSHATSLPKGDDAPIIVPEEMGAVDFEAIRAAALLTAASLLAAWLPKGRREGAEWVPRNPTRADDAPGSFKINIATGAWADFATGDKGGDLIALRAYLDGTNQAVAARRLAADLGIEAGSPGGLTLERYVEAKHLPLAFLQKLGLETIADPWGKPRPVLAMPYRQADGTFHRQRLRVALEKPADGAPRMIWDKRVKTGAILYGLDTLPAKGCPLYLVEGESDAQTLWFHGIDAVGCPGSGSYSPARDDALLDGYDIIALIEPGAGGAALIKQLAKSRLKARIRLARLDGFKDVSALHCAAPDRFEAVLATATASAEPLAAYLKRSEKPAEKSPPAADRIDIQLTSGEQARVTDETLAVMRRDGTLYERGGALMRLAGNELAEADEHWLADYLSRRVNFFRMKEQNNELVRVAADPPAWLCKRIRAKKGERGLPELAGTITAPTLRRDGSLLDQPGFDPATGLLLRPGDWPHIPERPSLAEVEAVWQTLWLPFSEFPYVNDDDRAVAVSAILTALVRRTLPLAPAFSFDAPVAGSGKTLLATCIAELCGSEPNIVPECDEEEIRKRLLSVLMDGTPVLLLDNIKGTFKSSALEAFLTARYYADRVLGASRLARLPTNILLLISGNNFLPAGDLWRRILTCRIDPRVEDVHMRSFERDAVGHVRTHRQAMVAAGMTILRGFIAAGSPRAASAKMASYEAFDSLIRQCVIWLGREGLAPVTDPAASIAKVKALDPETQKLTAFLTAVHDVMGNAKWRAAELVARANNAALSDESGQALTDALTQIAGNDYGRLNVRILSAWIARQVDRRCEGLRVTRAGIYAGNNRWQVSSN